MTGAAYHLAGRLSRHRAKRDSASSRVGRSTSVAEPSAGVDARRGKDPPMPLDNHLLPLLARGTRSISAHRSRILLVLAMGALAALASGGLADAARRPGGPP